MAFACSVKWVGTFQCSKCKPLQPRLGFVVKCGSGVSAAQSSVLPIQAAEERKREGERARDLMLLHDVIQKRSVKETQAG